MTNLHKLFRHKPFYVISAIALLLLALVLMPPTTQATYLNPPPLYCTHYDSWGNCDGAAYREQHVQYIQCRGTVEEQRLNTCLYQGYFQREERFAMPGIDGNGLVWPQPYNYCDSNGRCGPFVYPPYIDNGQPNVVENFIEYHRWALWLATCSSSRRKCTRFAKLPTRPSSTSSRK